MNEIIPFNFQGAAVRVIQNADGQPWWVAKDVCDVLDLENVTWAVSGLEEDEKAELSITQVSSNGTEQKRKTIIINEPGLYSLVLRSRKPEAKEFKRWITHEVLPRIRKTGSYQIQPADLNPLRVLQQTVNELVRLDSIQADHENRIAKIEAEKGGSRSDYFSVRGFANLHGIAMPRVPAVVFGKQAAQASRAAGVEIGSVHDEGFGKVNTYHVSILREVFGPLLQSN